METNEIITQEPVPPTPQELIAREHKLAGELARIGSRYNDATFLQQLNKAVTGCENRIRVIQEANNMEVTV